MTNQKTNLDTLLASVAEIDECLESLNKVGQVLMKYSAFRATGERVNNIVLSLKDETSNIRVAAQGLSFEVELEKLKAYRETIELINLKLKG